MCDSHQPLNGADAARMTTLLRQELIEELLAQCAACSLPAVTDGYCRGHARLGEYRVTDEKTWAAND